MYPGASACLDGSEEGTTSDNDWKSHCGGLLRFRVLLYVWARLRKKFPIMTDKQLSIFMSCCLLEDRAIKFVFFDSNGGSSFLYLFSLVTSDFLRTFAAELRAE